MGHLCSHLFATDDCLTLLLQQWQIPIVPECKFGLEQPLYAHHANGGSRHTADIALLTDLNGTV